MSERNSLIWRIAFIWVFPPLVWLRWLEARDWKGQRTSDKRLRPFFSTNITNYIQSRIWFPPALLNIYKSQRLCVCACIIVNAYRQTATSSSSVSASALPSTAVTLFMSLGQLDIWRRSALRLCTLITPMLTDGFFFFFLRAMNAKQEAWRLHKAMCGIQWL